MALPSKKPMKIGNEAGPKMIQVKRGELLFAEGENSKSMYFLQTGMLRIFKKKGNASIEIATIHSGQIVGELAFLDGQPRSASGEALTDCTLVEVSGQTFVQTMAKIPDWLKLLLKTVVGRLRSASTRIRQLEQASTAFDYSSKDGKRSSHYVYLSPLDVLKGFSSVMLTASRAAMLKKGTAAGGKIAVRFSHLERYGNHVMGVPVAKIMDLLDVLAQVGVLEKIPEGAEIKEVQVIDLDFLEKFLIYYNEENLLEPSKRHDVTLKGFIIMSLIVKYLGDYLPDDKTGLTKVNLAQIQLKEHQITGREPFRFEDFPELAKLGYATNVAVRSSEEATTEIKAAEFSLAYRFQRVVKAIQAVNEKKSR